MDARGPPSLFGRAEERQLLDRLLNDVRDGRSAVVVIRGEAGSGRLRCWTTAPVRRPDCASRSRGRRGGGELAFAGLHQLCAPMLDQLGDLPRPSRAPCASPSDCSAGRAGPPPRRPSVLSLFSAVAEERPLVCLVDDAQWLDGASARCSGSSPGGCWRSRWRRVRRSRPGCRAELEALPELARRWAERAHARSSCYGESSDRSTTGSATGSSPRRVATRWRCRVAAGPQPAELAGGFEVSVRCRAGRIEDHFLRRARALPGDAEADAHRGCGAGGRRWPRLRVPSMTRTRGRAARRRAEDAGLLEFGHGCCSGIRLSVRRRLIGGRRGTP